MCVSKLTNHLNRTRNSTTAAHVCREVTVAAEEWLCICVCVFVLPLEHTVTVRKQLSGTPQCGCLKAPGVCLIFHGISAMLDLPERRLVW